MTAAVGWINTGSNYCWRLKLVEWPEWHWVKECDSTITDGPKQTRTCPTVTLSSPFVVAETRRRNLDPLTDPDYFLIVRVHDMGGMSENALMGSATVYIVVEQNLWVNPGPITVRENLQETYPIVITRVRWITLTFRKFAHGNHLNTIGVSLAVFCLFL